MTNFLNEISFLIPDFLNLQRESFYSFLDKGLIDEFQKKNPILIKKKKIKIIFCPKFYQIKIPLNNIEFCISQSKTYGGKLYIPIH